MNEKLPLVAECMSTPVMTTSKWVTVDKVVKVMDKLRIGCVVVTDEGDRPIGIITERDLLKKILREGRNPAEVKVEEVMTSPVITTKQDVNVIEAVRVMIRNGVKRLPVVDETGRLVGIITLVDVIRKSPSLIDIGKPLLKKVRVSPEASHIYG